MNHQLALIPQGLLTPGRPGDRVQVPDVLGVGRAYGYLACGASRQHDSGLRVEIFQLSGPTLTRVESP